MPTTKILRSPSLSARGLAEPGTLSGAGSFMLNKVHYKVDVHHAFHQVLVITDGEALTVTDLHGEILIEHTRPGPGVTYVGNRRPAGRPPRQH